MKGIVTAMAAAVMLSGCFDRPLSEEDKALAERLRSQLVNTQQSIGEAESADAQYAGGLIKSLIAIRLETLKTNEALLEQRILAIESRSPVRVETSIIAPNSDLAAALEADIATAKADLTVERAEAEQYGGLVGALKASAVATRENTIAQLEQRYLAAKYGLIPPLALVESTSASVQAPAAIPAAFTPTTKAAPGDGPLGFAKGQTVEQIEAMIGVSLSVVDAASNLYSAKTSPIPNPAFEQFGLVISPVLGLCQIRALGNDITSNSFGSQLQAEFSTLKASLTGVYGKPEEYDFLRSGSIWKDDRDWMMGLYKKERYLTAGWGAAKLGPLKNHISEIGLEARAQNGSQGYVYLQYDFDNTSACSEEIEQKKQSTL